MKEAVADAEVEIPQEEAAQTRSGPSPTVLWDVVRTAAARAGIDKLAPHDLRRTCAPSVPLGRR